MSSLKKINSKKAVIFDFDDTLAKTGFGKNLGLKSASLKIYDYLKKRGIKIGFNNLYKKIKKITCKIKSKRIYSRNLWWLSAMKEFSKEPPQDAFLDELTKIYWDAVKKKSELYKDTLSVLAYLKKKKYMLGMVSDTDEVKGLKIERIKKLNFEKWFDFIIVAGEDTEKVKPDKAPFFLISKKLKLKPQQCVFVGDNPCADILGAKKTGMATVLIKRNDCKIKIKPDRIIHNLIELKKIL